MPNSDGEKPDSDGKKPAVNAKTDTELEKELRGRHPGARVCIPTTRIGGDLSKVKSRKKILRTTTPVDDQTNVESAPVSRQEVHESTPFTAPSPPVVSKSTTQEEVHSVAVASVDEIQDQPWSVKTGQGIIDEILKLRNQSDISTQDFYFITRVDVDPIEQALGKFYLTLGLPEIHKEMRTVFTQLLKQLVLENVSPDEIRVALSSMLKEGSLSAQVKGGKKPFKPAEREQSISDVEASSVVNKITERLTDADIDAAVEAFVRNDFPSLLRSIAIPIIEKELKHAAFQQRVHEEADRLVKLASEGIMVEDVQDMLHERLKTLTKGKIDEQDNDFARDHNTQTKVNFSTSIGHGFQSLTQSFKGRKGSPSYDFPKSKKSVPLRMISVISCFVLMFSGLVAMVPQTKGYLGKVSTFIFPGSQDKEVAVAETKKQIERVSVPVNTETGREQVNSGEVLGVGSTFPVEKQEVVTVSSLPTSAPVLESKEIAQVEVAHPVPLVKTVSAMNIEKSSLVLSKNKNMQGSTTFTSIADFYQ